MEQKTSRHFLKPLLILFVFTAISRTTIFTIILTLFFSSILLAAQRGIKVTAKTPSGQAIPLYSGSYALVIGNGNYSNGWDPLSGAIRDVKDVARALKENGFKVILKTNLTRITFNRAFADFFHKYGRMKTNRLLFYYAGHGYTQRMFTGEDQGYMVMVDAPAPEKDPVGFEVASVDMQVVVTQAKKVKARHVLFMFDSCFSGAILNLRERVIPEAISDSVSLPVRQFITAGRANEPVPDHSIFKQAFLDLLEGRDKEPIPDGYITGEELGLYLKNKVPEYNPTQHPQYGKIKDIRLDKGDFVFSLNLETRLLNENSSSSKAINTPNKNTGLDVFINSLGMKFVKIPAGKFVMGSAISPVEVAKKYRLHKPIRYIDEHPQHQVTISRPFYMQTTEVTQKQWEIVMGSNPSQYKNFFEEWQKALQTPNGRTLIKMQPSKYEGLFPNCENNWPVESVSWNDCQEFIRKLNRMEANVEYRLPTEAEWEYACRAGTKSSFSWGNNPECSKANFGGVSGECKERNPGRPMKVGSFLPNGWGLYDMHANVEEWCQDWYGRYPSNPEKDPAGPTSGEECSPFLKWFCGNNELGLPGCLPGKVRRGGTFYYGASSCRSAYRHADRPESKSELRGFRLVRIVTKNSELDLSIPSDFVRNLYQICEENNTSLWGDQLSLKKETKVVII